MVAYKPTDYALDPNIPMHRRRDWKDQTKRNEKKEKRLESRKP